MRTDLFDFDLPEDRIALRPAVPRDAARLLVVRPGAATVLEDRTMRDLPELLRAGDALVVNDTKVIPEACMGAESAAAPMSQPSKRPSLSGSMARAGSLWPGRASGWPSAMWCASAAKAASVSSINLTPLSKPKGRGRDHARVCLSRRRARSGARRARRYAVAAIHRRAPRRRREGSRRLSDHVRV